MKALPCFTLRHLWSWLSLVLAVSLGPARAHAQPTILDGLDDPSAWSVVCADGVKASLSRCEGAAGGALRLDFEFTSGAGFCVLRRILPLELPLNYRFGFMLRGEAPANNLEFKLVDPSGENVWWVNRRAYEFPGDWQRVSYRARHFKFAWGPSGGARMDRIGSLEFAIASSSGGKGFVCFDELTFEPLDPPLPPGGQIGIAFSSSADGRPSPTEVPDDHRVDWASAPDDSTPIVNLSFDGVREFGGLDLVWDSHRHPIDYDLEASTDGVAFETVATIRGSSGGRRFVPVVDGEARRLRVRVLKCPPGGVTLESLELAPVESSQNLSAVLSHVAARAAPGCWPRHLLGKQSYWTVVGVSGDRDEALLSEDGAIEVGKGGFTLEPFIRADGRTITWASGEVTQSLTDGSLPIPSVTRRADGLTMEITALADGSPADATLRARYALTNSGATRRSGWLVLAARPVQVLPAWQDLNMSGGASPIRTIAWDGHAMVVNGSRAIVPSRPPARFTASTYAGGDVVELLEQRRDPDRTDVEDPAALASAAMMYEFDLAPGQRTEVSIASPFAGVEAARRENAPGPAPSFDDRAAALRALWTSELDRVRVHLPPSARAIQDSVRSTLAYILINRDGPAIQPGSRCYERSWIRDGCLTSSALLEFGHAKEAVDFVDWYARSIFPDGKAPCVVDQRGPDPVPENDSHGQYIFAVMNAYRFTHDRTILERHWPTVQRVVAYIESLRARRTTPEFQSEGTRPPEPGKNAVPVRAFYGLMPESISHEGYSAKPMHSYWDDFFTLRGLKDAAAMAEVLGASDAAGRYGALRDAFSSDLYRSIDLAARAHAIPYLPGCVELGDFDSTSTTVAIWPCGESDGPARERLRATFDRYWTFAMDRARPGAHWEAYTPYELRHVGAFVRLGQPERAHTLLEFFLKDQRPPGWNHWAEVVFQDKDAPRFIGDMPHTWCGSDFLNSVRSMLAYERESDGALVVFAGVPRGWAENNPGVSFVGLPTHFGALTARVRADGEKFLASLAGEASAPGGIVVCAPFPFTPARATVNGREAVLDGSRVTVRELPAEVVFEP